MTTEMEGKDEESYKGTLGCCVMLLVNKNKGILFLPVITSTVQTANFK